MQTIFKPNVAIAAPGKKHAGGKDEQEYRGRFWNTAEADALVFANLEGPARRYYDIPFYAQVTSPGPNTTPIGGVSLSVVVSG